MIVPYLVGVSPLVIQMFSAAKVLGGEARIVGGAVRNWIAGYPIGDIDMAVNLPIETMASHFQGVMCVLSMRLQHGTIKLCFSEDTMM